MSETNDVRVLADELNMAAAERKPFVLNGPDSKSFAAVPMAEGRWELNEIQRLPNSAEVLMPKIVSGMVQLQTVESLIAYVNRFKNSDTSLFADIQSSTIVGIIDYHLAPKREDAAGEKLTAAGQPVARLRAHTATLVLPKSIEWMIWTGIDGDLMTHVNFASFLEENDVDILPLGQMKDGAGNMVEDAPTNIYELIREMQVKSAFGASSVVRNGDYVNVEMQKGDDITTKRNVALPLSIDLSIPVYFGERPVPLKALIRRRVDEGSLRLGIKLVRPEQVRQDEFKRIVSEIEQDVMLPTLYGKA